MRHPDEHAAGSASAILARRAMPTINELLCHLLVLPPWLPVVRLPADG
jgi:hypothetical protein